MATRPRASAAVALLGVVVLFVGVALAQEPPPIPRRRPAMVAPTPTATPAATAAPAPCETPTTGEAAVVKEAPAEAAEAVAEGAEGGEEAPPLGPREKALQRADHELMGFQTGAAREVLEPFVERAKEDAEIAVTVGRILEQEKKYNDAVKQLKEASTLAGQDPFPQLYLGETYLRLRKSKEAAAAFKKAGELAQATLEKDEENSTALYQLGWAQQRQRQFDKAVESFSKVAVLNPDEPLAHYQLGVTRLYQQEWADAVKALTAALELESGLAYAYYYRGLAQDRLGKKDQLVLDMERFLALAASAPEAENATAIVKAAKR